MSFRHLFSASGSSNLESVNCWVIKSVRGINGTNANCKGDSSSLEYRGYSCFNWHYFPDEHAYLYPIGGVHDSSHKLDHCDAVRILEPCIPVYKFLMLGSNLHFLLFVVIIVLVAPAALSSTSPVALFATTVVFVWPTVLLLDGTRKMSVAAHIP